MAGTVLPTSLDLASSEAEARAASCCPATSRAAARSGLAVHRVSTQVKTLFQRRLRVENGHSLNVRNGWKADIPASVRNAQEPEKVARRLAARSRTRWRECRGAEQRALMPGAPQLG